MWTFSNLDRSNIGNAYAGGMKKTLNMSSTDYSVALLVFFIGYVAFEIPSNMILVRLRPSIYLPAIMFLWGGVAIALAGCKSTPALAGVRVVLGLAESGFAPGVLYLLSTWYKKKELARRYTLFWLGTPVSGMVGGILAGAIIERMDGTAGLHGWQWLFVVSEALALGSVPPHCPHRRGRPRDTARHTVGAARPQLTPDRGCRDVRRGDHLRLPASRLSHHHPLAVRGGEGADRAPPQHREP